VAGCEAAPPRAQLNDAGCRGPLSVVWEDADMDREAGAREALEFVCKVDFAPSALAFDASTKHD